MPVRIVGVEATADGIRVLLEAEDGERRLGRLTAGVLWALVQTRPDTWDGRPKLNSG